MAPSAESVLAFVFGACIGSFVNVVIHRLPRGESLVAPRSRCTSCRATIAWYDNLPLASWLLLRGRCRQCGGNIDARYPIVELLTGFIAYGLHARWGLSLESLVGFYFAYRWNLPVGPTDVALLGVLYAVVFAGHKLIGSWLQRAGKPNARPSLRSNSASG